MTQQVPYRVLQKHGDIELRHYPGFVTADVRVSGDPGSAGNRAFRSLASYIGGNNTTRTSMAMTAPVRQESERLAMTAPVLQEESDEGWVVSFVLPGSGSLEDFPEPRDPKVTLREVREHDAASIRWTGRWTYNSVAERTEQLRSFMATRDWHPDGEPVWARYDPP